MAFFKNGNEKKNLKTITMIDPVTGWFEITQYNNKRVISLAKLF